MRNRLERELEELGRELTEMGFLIEQAIEKAVGALTRGSAEDARQAIAFDGEVDEKERDIERRCLKLLLLQQPVAADLRFISTALKMITDMERIGDQAADIAELRLSIPTPPASSQMELIGKMANASIAMVKDSIDAFVVRSEEMALAVIREDDLVDDLFLRVREQLIALIREDSARGEEFADLLMVAKYLERIGDHATNIAEWVVFAVTGIHKNSRIL